MTSMKPASMLQLKSGLILSRVHDACSFERSAGSAWFQAWSCGSSSSLVPGPFDSLCNSPKLTEPPEAVEATSLAWYTTQRWAKPSSDVQNPALHIMP